jgi:serine/threonine protein kinase
MRSLTDSLENSITESTHQHEAKTPALNGNPTMGPAHHNETSHISSSPMTPELLVPSTLSPIADKPACPSSVAARREKFKRISPLAISPSAPNLSTGTNIVQQSAAVPSPFTDFWAWVSTDNIKKRTEHTIKIDFLEKIKDLGFGAQASVDMVVDTRTRKFYARKIMRLLTSAEVGDKVTQQILQEIRSYCSSNSPYIVPFYGAFYHDGTVQIILEYMNGGTLKDLYEKVGRIPESFLSNISEQILRGLQYLHEERRLIHRDIKPSNLLVNLKGEVKIADFGVSRELSNSIKCCNTFTGTRIYMGPERLESKKGYTISSDIWSAGISIVECAMGRYPFGNTCKTFDLLIKIVHNPLPIDEWLPANQFSVEFRDFISLCLCKDPEQRYSATRLLNHPFITKYKTLAEPLSLSNWISSVVNVEE